MFANLGVDPAQSAVYELLLRGGTSSAAELAMAGSERDPRRLAEVLLELESRGLVRRVTGATPRWCAVAPDLAVELLIADRENEHRRARAGTARLMELYRQSGNGCPDDDSIVEVVKGADAALSQWRALLLSARDEVRVLDKPPYLSHSEEFIGLENDSSERDVCWRVVYERSSFELPGRLAEVLSLVAGGEKARVTPDLPFKLGLVDRRGAVLPVVGATGIDSVLVIRPSPLLDVLHSTFDLYWDRSIPFTGAAAAEPEPEVDPQLLALLAAGLTDESIARQLGMAPRTAQRRVRQLMDRCGAQTRFQAGVQAIRHGWL
ncbi:hypothetical protein N8J89_09715 [Crossiella sp. CA-258035]|uniref:hypothetical protein n=1 Tax=Crossiella sp. CA-258035 TaxID=2981138 RepID=UPI0024BC0495|nr:hypothetical protein [Crossiella sp. CA-258035]WHT21310.1 hypothetical protein N8J89_09715 [Crossiella sp. CA-258035]